MSVYVLLCIVLILVTIFWLRKKIVNPKFQSPDFEGHYLGHSLWLLLLRAWNKVDTIEDLVAGYKKVKQSGKKFGIIQEVDRPNILIADAELVKLLMVKHFEFATERRALPELKSDKYFNKIFQLLTGPTWRPTRNALTPAFTTRNLKEMFQILNSSAQFLVNWINTRLDSDGSLLNIRIPMEKVTVDMISKLAFGFDPKTFEKEESLFETQVKSMDLSGGNPFRFTFIILFPKLANFFRFSIFSPESQEFFGQVVEQEVQRRSENRDKNPGDYLQFLIDRKEKGKTASLFEIDGIVGNSIIFINAGSLPVQSNLLTTFYQLARNPHVQNKLHEEVKRIWHASNAQFLYEEVNYLEYLDNVIKESLRMCPPAPVVEREATASFQMPGTDFLVQKGWLMTVPISAIQNDSSYFTSPEIFDPSRFSEMNKETIQQGTFLPFGEGPRHCLGKRVALLQLKLVLCHLVLNFKFEVCSKTEVPMKYKDGGLQGPVMPQGEVWLKVEKRKMNQN